MRKRSIYFVLPTILLVAFLGFAMTLWQGSSDSIANAAQTGADEQPSVSVSVKATGYTDGTTTSLEKKSYHAGEVVNLNWKGAVSGTDLIIPISITYGNNKIDIGALNKIESLQSDNLEFEALMGQKGTMTTYDKLKDYVQSEHLVTLGKSIDGLNVYIDYAKVSPVYRLYNIITSEHMFTTNKTEYDNFVDLCKKRQDSWIGEGIDWLAPTTTDNTKVVHRLYNDGLGRLGNSSHYYTSDEVEIARLIANNGWSDDGESVQYRSGGSTAIYTCYNEALKSAHHYTSSLSEWQGLKVHGWALEEDKNGSAGVFQCLSGTSWSFDSNYYKVEHHKQNLDGTYTLAETQYISGKAGDKTSAVAKSYAGFKAGDVAVKTIMNDDSTVVRINYSRQTYSLTLNGNGKTATVSGKSYVYGEQIKEPEAITADGQDFAGWYLDPDCTTQADFTTLTMTSDGLTLYAKWNAKPTTTYTVVHVYQKTDGNWPEKGEEGYVEETKTGIIGDKTDAQAQSEIGFSAVSGWNQATLDDSSNEIIRIEYTRNKHYISFDFNEFGENPVAREIYYGEEIATPEVPSSATHNFAGWYTTKSCDHNTHWGHDGEQARLMPDSDFTLYAHWSEKDVFWVTFETNGGSRIADEEVIDGGTLQAPGSGATKREGWTFVAWYDDENFETPTDFTQAITSSKTIYAKWQGNSGIKYVVKHISQNADGTFDDKGVVEETLSGTAGELVSFDVKQYAGFEVPSVPAVEIEGDGSSVVEVKYYRSTHSIKFNSNGHGVAPEEMTGLLYGSTVKAPTPEPDETGWIFEGWYTEADAQTEWIFGAGGTTMPNSDVELYAKWQIESYTVSFETYGGSVEAAQTVNFGSRASRPSTEPTKAGYAFVNWYEQDLTKLFDFATEIRSNTTIYAKWEDLSRGTSNADGKVTLYDKKTNKTVHAMITFDSDGYASTDQTALDGAYFEVNDDGSVSVKLPSEPDARGLDVTVTLTDDSGSPIADKRKVEASDSDGITRGQVEADTNGKALFAGKNRGESDENGKVVVFDPSTGKSVEALIEFENDGKYTPLKGASVEATKSGQVNVIGTSETDTSSVKVTLKDKDTSTVIDDRPVKWTDSGQSESRGTKNTTSGEVTFTIFTLTYDVDGGSSIDPQRVREGGVPTRPTNPTKSGVYFLGWYEGDKTTLYDFTEPLTSDKTIYACWTEGSYTVIFHANDNAATGSMSDMSRKLGDNKQLTGNGFSKVVDGVVYGMKYWTTNADGSGKQYRDKFLGDLDLTGGVPIHLYAQWTTVDINPYWIAASSKITTGSSSSLSNVTNMYYTDPETSVIKTTAQIQEDMSVLHDTEHKTYTEARRNEVLAEYQEIMNKDDYHLYTKLTKDQGTAVDNYAEFRIVQLGAHEATGDKTDGSKYADGSVVTFQAIHALKDGVQINTTRTNNGGWGSSTLYASLNSGTHYSLFSEGLTSDILEVEKWTRMGSKNGSLSDELISSKNKIWIMSLSEYMPGIRSSYSNHKMENEGDQYDFWVGKVTSIEGNNSSIKQHGYRRSGSVVAGTSWGGWCWTRSPVMSNNYEYCDGTGGAMINNHIADGTLGIAPCFCF